MHFPTCALAPRPRSGKPVSQFPGGCFMIRLLSVVALVCGLFLAPAARAQDLFPGASLDTAIPAPETVIGHPVGRRVAGST